jgi:uncharacterized membrane protein (DUF485 family)
MEVLNKVTGWLKGLTETGLSLLALGVVLQVLFGAAVPFLKVDVVGSVVDVTKQLGSEGLVGLVAVWVLVSLYNRKAPDAG